MTMATVQGAYDYPSIDTYQWNLFKETLSSRSLWATGKDLGSQSSKIILIGNKIDYPRQLTPEEPPVDQWNLFKETLSSRSLWATGKGSQSSKIILIGNKIDYPRQLTPEEPPV
ncbi:3148_t:CDS:2, partial [Gigaspora margarita]